MHPSAFGDRERTNITASQIVMVKVFARVGVTDVERQSLDMASLGSSMSSG